MDAARSPNHREMQDASGKINVDGLCAFCGQKAQLRDSHVLPAFVYRWLRGHSGTGGHIRHTSNPNRRVQDGLKLPWLCCHCEGQFSRFETAFATKVFHPWHAGTRQIAYQDWLLKFCVSVSWRVLRYTRGHNKNAQYTVEQQALMDQAEACWRAFLKNNAPHPGPFEQHLLIFDVIESTTIPDLPTNTNRFITGAVTFDIVGSARSLMTFAKLGRFMIFGMIQKGTCQWEVTKVHVRRGMLKPGKFTVPIGLIHLIREKAAHAAAMIDTMSAAQRAKVEKHILDNLDAFAASDQFASIEADARMFGDAAVIWKDEP